MAKYKVGDKVRIVSERPRDCWNPEMDKYLGKTMTIIKSGINRNGVYYHMEDSNDFAFYWYWYEDMIAGLAEQKKPADENLSVTIHFHGRLTVAELYKNGRVVKVENARCNPKDTYDRGEGAKVAINRLFEKKQEDVEETVNPAKKWKTGDKAVVVRQNGRLHHWYRIPTVVEVSLVDLRDNTCLCRDVDDYGHTQWVRMDCLEPYKEKAK